MNGHPTLIASGGNALAGQQLLGAVTGPMTGGKRPNALKAMGHPIQLQMFKGSGLQGPLMVKV